MANGLGFISVRSIALCCLLAVAFSPIGQAQDISEQRAKDFAASVAPKWQSALPGETIRYDIGIYANSAFNEQIDLSCGDLPSGVTCDFKPSQVTPQSAVVSATMDVAVPPTMPQGTYSFIAAAAGRNTRHTQTVQIIVGGLTGTVSPSAQTIAIGSSGTFSVVVSSVNGFAGSIRFACPIASASVACNFNPPEVALTAGGSATTILTVSVSSTPATAAPITMSPPTPDRLFSPAQWKLGIGVWSLMGMSICAVLSWHRYKARVAWTRGLSVMMAVVTIALGLLSCSGAGISSLPANTNGDATSVTSSPGVLDSGLDAGARSTDSKIQNASTTLQITLQAQSGSARINLSSITITIP